LLPRISRRLSALGLVSASLALLAFAPGALAANLGVDGSGNLVYTASDTTVSAVEFDQTDVATVEVHKVESGITYDFVPFFDIGTFTDNDPITTGTNCTNDADADTTPDTDGNGDPLYTCTGVTGQVQATAGDEDDAIDASGNFTDLGGSGLTTIPLVADLGTGNDSSIGGQANDVIHGGDGNDNVLGDASGAGSGGAGGDDQVFGEAGDDNVSGGVGNDTIDGGTGDDTNLTGGPGTENISGGDGNDSFIAGGPGDDTLDGGAGNDSLWGECNGGCGVPPNTGNDTITGGDGNDTLIGGDGDDLIAGGRGNDTALLGAGNDTFVWNPGDGSDTVEGQDGNDTLLFNGANIAETINVSANGSRVRFTRDVANITMDVNDIEHIQFNALGGADKITVNNLAGTDAKQVDIDLAGTPGGTQGDGAADLVTVNGTNGNDTINVVASGTKVTVTGLPAQVSVDHADAGDVLAINAGNGNDTINASTVPAVLSLTVDGGAGNDTIIGGQGNDTLLGGDGNDNVNGGRGNDVALLGNGNDTFIWNPGDGSDIVEGQAGTDTLVFNGSNVAENMDISANGSRARLFRDVGAITMDLNGVENIQVNALGGADTITVNDLTGTDAKQVNIDLSGTAGSGQGDGAGDNVIVNSTAGNDTVTVASSGAGVVVNGLAAKVTLTGTEGALDSLTVNGLAGNDTINASGLKAGQVNLTINGGDGDDKITGSQGNDLVFGGRGNDMALLGAGDDTLVWNPGDGSDTVDGQAGNDTLLFNGANINENINISANGGHARLSRDVANITMDLDNVETVDVKAKGGADNITVDDLSKTDVDKVNIDLGGADGASDTVVLNATNGDDAITITNNNGVVTVTSLGSEVTISNFDANDRIVINGLGGDDVIEASGLTGMLLTANGDDGDDVLIGSAGNDTLTGGAGDDVLIGGPGVDILDGGTGDNILIQSLTVAPMASSNSTGDTATAADGSHAAALATLGQAMASSFVTAGDGHGAMPLADPASSQQQPLLTQPHA
jgi:Ca2+-binding RTX toxin-like protein